MLHHISTKLLHIEFNVSRTKSMQEKILKVALLVDLCFLYSVLLAPIVHDAN
jgi:hypothetical protein